MKKLTKCKLIVEKEKHVTVFLRQTIKRMQGLVRASNDQYGSLVFFTETFVCTNQLTSQPSSDISGQPTMGGKK